jgi:Fic family protein
MRSFVDLDRTFGSQPREIGARLARIDFGRGREALYRDQLPELLDALAQATRVESITASSAIEGVVVDEIRVAGLLDPVSPTRRFRNRSEREFAGYRDAIDEVIREDPRERLTVPYLLHLHRVLFSHTDVLGGALKREQNFIASYEAGHRVVLFTPPSPRETEFLLPELLDRYREAVATDAAHPIVLIGALILDLLAIHPVADGNGRVARLLTTRELLDKGYELARYVSVEQRMYETKTAYYDALLASQQRWHTGDHTIWPWVGYLVDVLGVAYDDLESKVAERRGLAALSKQDQVRRYVLEHAPRVFRVADVRSALPGVSQATISLVLGTLRDEGSISPVEGSSGRNAAWRRAEDVP